ncbi:MAG: hypothetical protein Q7K55_08380 [Candidatus Levybacteria bacterium]|nr:hypothetical protein [Candidatus Levybacteria bacterium]
MRKLKRIAIATCITMACILFIAFLARYFNVLRTNLDPGMLMLLGVIILLLLFPFIKDFELFSIFKVKFRKFK